MEGVRGERVDVDDEAVDVREEVVGAEEGEV